MRTTQILEDFTDHENDSIGSLTFVSVIAFCRPSILYIAVFRAERHTAACGVIEAGDAASRGGNFECNVECVTLPGIAVTSQASHSRCFTFEVGAKRPGDAIYLHTGWPCADDVSAKRFTMDPKIILEYVD